MIFTWNGERFQFITDVLGVAPLGASAGDGEYFPVDHDEYVQIPGEALVPVDGALRDPHHRGAARGRLPRPDPADRRRPSRQAVEIFTNDKFKGPPFPEFRLFGVERRGPSRARARDYRRARRARAPAAPATAAIPDGFRRDYAGRRRAAPPRPRLRRRPAPDDRAVLVLTGWVDWADGSTFLGAAQEAGAGCVMPAPAGEGRGRAVADGDRGHGHPAGKPKTIVVDLTGKFLSASREVRIVTNLCVYWDEIFLSEETAEPPARADASWRPPRPSCASAASRRPMIHPERKQPETFDYHALDAASRCGTPRPGSTPATATSGPCSAEVDDRLVVMGSGDELRLRSTPAALPPLPAGWRRDFLLFVDGWAKDGDANTAFSQTVEPLPFHGMCAVSLPGAERFPDDAAHADTGRTTTPARRCAAPPAGREGRGAAMMRRRGSLAFCERVPRAARRVLGREPAGLPSPGRRASSTSPGKAGIRFVHNSGRAGKKLLPETLGAGRRLLDADGDGWPDSCSSTAGTGAPRGTQVAAAPSTATTGDGTFTDVTAGSGLDVELYGLGVAVADYDNDGREDVYITALEGDRLFHNEGGGKFQDVTAAGGHRQRELRHQRRLARLRPRRPARSLRRQLRAVDARKATSGARSTARPSPTARPSRTRAPPRSSTATSAAAQFEDVTGKAGVADPDSKSLGVAVLDYDVDGWPDLFVANDTQPNKLYRNQRNGTLHRGGAAGGRGLRRGRRGARRHGRRCRRLRPLGPSAPVVGNFSQRDARPLPQRGRGAVRGRGARLGGGARSLLTLTFGVFFFDYDLDGFLDIFAANGHIEEEIERVQPRVTYRQPPLLFRNLGQAASSKHGRPAAVGVRSLKPADRGARGAPTATSTATATSTSLVTTNHGPAYLFRNDGGNRNHWLAGAHRGHEVEPRRHRRRGAGDERRGQAVGDGAQRLELLLAERPGADLRAGQRRAGRSKSSGRAGPGPVSPACPRTGSRSSRRGKRAVRAMERKSDRRSRRGVLVPRRRQGRSPDPHRGQGRAIRCTLPSGQRSGSASIWTMG